MTRNPYAPPGTQVKESPPEPPPKRVGRAPFWARFYLSPIGRTGRLFYWLFGFIPLTLLGAGFGFFLPRTSDGSPYLLTAAILLQWPQAVILARRFHDINLMGWWVAVFWFVPIAVIFLHVPLPRGAATMAGWLGAIALGLIPGTRGPNKYGSDPRGN